jgi:PAS domain S-box-containing protein
MNQSVPRGSLPELPDGAGPLPVSPEERRILIFAPTGNDGPLTLGFLQHAGLEAEVCHDMAELVRRLEGGCGAIMLAEETLELESAQILTQKLAAQPSWSDLPVAIVTSGGELSQIRTQRLKAVGREINLTLLERPFRPTTLVRTLQVALRARQRQYQVRALLAQLNANEARVRRILEQNAIGIAETDLEGRFRLVNDQFCATVRRPREELLSLRIRDITHPDDIAVAVERREVLLSGRANTSILEKRYLHPDGSHVWVQDHLSAIRDAAGVLCGIAVASADITDRKNAEQAAERARDEAVAASRAKDDFLAALSHELRTPLNPVLLIASEGAHNAAYPPTARADFDTITRNVTLEARLFDDLLDLTRITRGKLTLDRQPHSIHASLRDALVIVEADLRQRQIVLQRDLSGETLVVLGDAVRLQQVWWNVLKNAVKFTPPGGTISLTTRLIDGQRAAVAVRDTGLGLTPEELARIFNTFAQGDHATGLGLHRFGGLGLGLAISKTLVELHGGTIFATSAGRDRGATFTIELPLVPATASSAKVTEPGVIAPHVAFESAHPRTTVLVVEDHEPTRIALTRLLLRRKFQVRSAGSVSEALAIAAGGGIDLLLSDVGLPDGNGFDLMRELRLLHGLRGIALTGYGKDEDIALSREAGFASHLTKPVDIRSLDKALRELQAMPASE